MTEPVGRRSRLAIVLYGVAVTGFAIDLVSLLIPAAPGQDQSLGVLPIYLAFLAYATVGMLILVRQPENKVGWLVGAVGFFPLLGGLTDVYVQRAADWPLADAARWFGTWYYVAGIDILPLLFLLFPDGRPASRRWRWPVLIAVIGLAAELVRYMTGPGDCGKAGCGNEQNPFQPAALRPFLGVLEAVGTIGLLVGLLAGAASLAWRFHRGRGAERQQVKWFAAAVGLDVLLAATAGASKIGDGLFAVILVIPAAAVVVAVLRYRLYDIDRLISRSVSYAILTGLLVGIYVLLVTGVTRLLPVSSSQAVAASTLTVAAMFQPLRRRLQHAVDRRFNRARYDAAHTVEEFSARLRGEVDLDSVRADLIAVVNGTLQPASVGLWLRNPDGAAS